MVAEKSEIRYRYYRYPATTELIDITIDRYRYDDKYYPGTRVLEYSSRECVTAVQRVHALLNHAQHYKN